MDNIILPPPQFELDIKLMHVLLKRRTIRKWKYEDLNIQQISNILWCACGETKKATKRSKNRRTIPSGCNSQIVKIYAVFSYGVYRYNEPMHRLDFVSNKDLSKNIGTQKMMQPAPFALLYVADLSNNTGVIKSKLDQKIFVASTEAGMMSQNVYLYCTGSKLNTALLGLCDREYLKQTLDLSDYSMVLYTQIIGKSI